MQAKAISFEQLSEQYLSQDAGELMADHGKSFYFASMIFTEARFRQIAKLYKVCRYIDDAADELAPAEARRALAAIRAELTAPAGERGQGVFGKMVAEVESFGVTRPQLLELVAGATFDAEGGSIDKAGDLIVYSYQVAGVVGLMMCPLLGVKDVAGHPHAIDLGIAMQLTNICRDVLEDAEQGRVYLPADQWQAAGLTIDVLATRGATPNALKTLVADTLALADRYYQSGYAGLCYIPFRPRLTILIAGEIYRHIGVTLLERECPVLDGRVFVSKPRKLWIALKSLRKVFSRSFWRPPQPLGHGQESRGQDSHEAALHKAIATKPGANA